MNYARFRTWSGTSLLFLCSLLFISSCDIVNPLDGIKAIINIKERGTSLTVVIYDAATEQPIGFGSDERLNITVGGPFEDEVIDIYNRPKNTFQSSEGFLTFAISDELTPDLQNPVALEIQVDGLGYLPTTETVELISDKDHTVEIFMIDPENLPEGVTGFSDLTIGNVDENGSLLEDVSFGIGTPPQNSGDAALLKNDPPPPPVDNITAGVSFRMQKGTIIFDQDNQPLQEGRLRASLYFINSSYTRLSTFGSGTINSQTDDYIFGRSGLVKVIIRDENNRRAYRFRGEQEEPPTTTFTYLRTFEPDVTQVPVWTTSAQVGYKTRWMQKGRFDVDERQDAFDRTVKQTSFQSSELPEWQMLASNIPACRLGLELRYPGTKLPLYAISSDLETGFGLTSGFTRLVGREDSGEEISSIRLQFVPAGREATHRVFNILNTEIGNTTIPDLCAAGSREIDVQNLEFDVTIERAGTCSSKPDLEVRPSFDAKMRGKNTFRWFAAGRATDGKIELTVPEPAEYIFGAYDGDRFRTRDLNLTQAADGDVLEDEIELPDDVCADID